MGTLNVIANLPSETLRMNACIACQKPGILPPLIDYRTNTYDYVCRNCNEKVTISLAESCLSKGLLDELRKNTQARELLREEIRNYTGSLLNIDQSMIQYFLGLTTDRPVTYEDWMEGKITGDVRSWIRTPLETLDRIKLEQSKIFDKLVDAKLKRLVDDYEVRSVNSFDPKLLLSNEIEAVKNILIKGRYKFETKPTNGFKIGVHSFHSFSTFSTTQEMYQSAIDGTLDLGIVPSEKQQIGVASMKAKLNCMIDAYAFGKFLRYLESPTSDSNEKISKAGVQLLEHRIEEMKEEFRQFVSKGFENIDDTQHKLFYELQSGQELIFNEFDELKDFLKTVNKKTWIQVLKAKLMLMLERQILSKDTVDFIIDRLNIDELGLGTKFLN